MCQQEDRAQRVYLKLFPGQVEGLFTRLLVGQRSLSDQYKIGSVEAEASVCPQNRAYGSAHGSSRKTDSLTHLSVNRSLPFISLSLQEPFFDHRAVDSPDVYVTGTPQLLSG